MTSYNQIPPLPPSAPAVPNTLTLGHVITADPYDQDLGFDDSLL